MKIGRNTCLLALAAALAACGAGPASLAGLGKPPSEADLPPRMVALRLHAANRLNVDAEGRALALVTRVYTLRHNAAFERAPYAAFQTPEAEKDAFGDDLVSVREVLLVPGQRYEAREKVQREAGYVGVVALFHSPAAQRWRASFPAAEAERGGVTVGLYACALSATAGAGAPAAKTLSSARCQ